MGREGSVWWFSVPNTPGLDKQARSEAEWGWGRGVGEKLFDGPGPDDRYWTSFGNIKKLALCCKDLITRALFQFSQLPASIQFSIRSILSGILSSCDSIGHTRGNDGH